MFFSSFASKAGEERKRKASNSRKGEHAEGERKRDSIATLQFDAHKKEEGRAHTSRQGKGGDGKESPFLLT